ncbi:DedA family protein [Novosphingobium album (ex Hu et al. 2023)]|uniref:DedA family protein n=1 Tax=Novosphingobium album (ex Hu et al. 2023) TaxID=2930093 RepID=A0ABT0AYL1_9SPHN|nr:DedA family protein [Novosphingobium album (ex Hu et al. 2023)]MCJ2177735.1 DedA family protein [Novosphingobium album (ex Hu et al. 2023)]
MGNWIYEVIAQGGYPGIVFLMALENIIPPIPSEVIMGVAGIAVARGHMSFWPVLLWGTVGSTLGNYVLFLAADRLGYERLRPVVDRWGRWLTLEWHDVQIAGRFLQRHGHWVVFLLRFAPMFRTVISIPAGLAHMGHVRFLLFTAMGAAIWNAGLILGGQWLGHTFARAEAWIGWTVIGLGILTILFYIWRMLRWKPRA